MMFFKKLEDGKPVGFLITEDNLRYFLTQINFDEVNPPEAFESLGYAVVIPTSKPEITPYHIVTEYETKNEDGTWQQNWNLEIISDIERKKIFDNQLKIVTENQTMLLNEYEDQLKDAGDNTQKLLIIQKWIDATKAMDLTDPFNVSWPTAENMASNLNDLLDPPGLNFENNLTNIRTG